jgi:hypothetical protein
MPTTRARYQVTETPAVARALDRAAKRWPGEPRSRLLLRLVDVGSDALAQDQQADLEAHRAAVTASSGAYADAFPAEYLAELRQDWPA